MEPNGKLSSDPSSSLLERSQPGHNGVTTACPPSPANDAHDLAACSTTATAGCLNELGQENVKHLPRGSQPVALIGEGAANAVFEIKVPQDGPRHQIFKGLLLRVAKVSSLGQHAKYDYISQQKFYETTIKPLLIGQNLVRQELVLVRDTGIVDELNRLLQHLDHTRKPKFRGTFIGQTDWGLLVEDMRPNHRREASSSSAAQSDSAPAPHSSSRVLVEFKPKWLSQSPSAPAGAVRCRQCALELQRQLTSKTPASDPFTPDRKPCPLTLLADPDDTTMPPAVSSPFRLAPHLESLPDRETLRASLARVFGHPLLRRLATEQRRLDATGPLRAGSGGDERFVVAMTIRDCTCFALVPRDDGGGGGGGDDRVELSLGDLDWKDPQVKMRHWRGTEQALIDGGFYTAEWILCAGVYYPPPTLCLLEWRPRAFVSAGTTVPDVIEIQNEDQQAAAHSSDSSSPLPPPSSSSPSPRVYKCVGQVGVLREKLEAYRLHRQGVESEAMVNPHRPSPPPLPPTSYYAHFFI